MPGPTHFLSSKTAQSSVLGALTPGKLLFVAVLIAATWLLLKWTR